jgi:hypothetical protein
MELSLTRGSEGSDLKALGKHIVPYRAGALWAAVADFWTGEEDGQIGAHNLTPKFFAKF